MFFVNLNINITVFFQQAATDSNLLKESSFSNHPLTSHVVSVLFMLDGFEIELSFLVNHLETKVLKEATNVKSEMN